MDISPPSLGGNSFSVFPPDPSDLGGGNINFPPKGPRYGGKISPSREEIKIRINVFRSFWAPLGAPEKNRTFCRPPASFPFIFREFLNSFWQLFQFSPLVGGNFYQMSKVFPPIWGENTQNFPPTPFGCGGKNSTFFPPIPLWGGGKIIADFAVFPPYGGKNPSLG